MVALLHGILDADKPAEIVATLLDALPSGSYLVASHLTYEHDTDPGASQQALRGAGVPMQKRASDDFADLAFTGLKLVPPGVVLVSEWRRPQGTPAPTPAEVNCYGGVARKDERPMAKTAILSAARLCPFPRGDDPPYPPPALTRPWVSARAG
jgi:hypothetical protein